ncbi:hypothetical protein [Saccharothrix deserti]|uniref:hypothetical protein n=1 Tax=Saccharothrix deserti TaxID=2593674 RepID=UPI00131AC805|nr:hypothetical protein [Saccharothrix deserti]
MTAIRHRRDTGEFVAFDQDGQAVWTLRLNVADVRATLCREPGTELTDEEWNEHLPGVTRQPVYE